MAKAQKGMTTYSVELAGERHNLRYDIDSMMEIETLAQALLNTSRADYYQMLDAPYNVRELVILIQAGINGYHRHQDDGQSISTKEVKELVQAHFDYIKKHAKTIPEWKAENQKMHDAVSTAVRLGVGLVPQNEPEPEKADPSPNESPGPTKTA